MTSERKEGVRVALLGCGTVGGGVLRLLRENREQIATRVGAPIEVTRVLVRDVEKDRVHELDRGKLTTDPEAVLGDASIDVVVEVMGGVDPARGHIVRAIEVRALRKLKQLQCGDEPLDAAPTPQPS